MVTPVIVVLDEARDLGFEITGQIIVLEHNAVLSRGWCLVMLGHGEQGYSLLSGDAASELRTTCFGPLVLQCWRMRPEWLGSPRSNCTPSEAHRKAEVTHVRSSQCEMFRLQGLLFSIISQTERAAA